MNRDNIIDWVTQVDMAFLKRTEPWNMFDKYEAFANLVASAEREACAKVCDHMASRCNDIRAAALESAAENIRSRGNT